MFSVKTLRLFFCLLFIFLGAQNASAQSCPSEAQRTLAHSHQLITVVSSSWQAKKAILIFWQRASTTSPWQQASAPMDAVIGKNGMAWGYAYSSLVGHKTPKAKREGDGKSPAGVYALGKKFGFAPETSPNYLRILTSTVCVDDPQSHFYNRIVDAAKTPKDWTSAEDMHSISQYRSGREILYRSNASARAGSCIFFHIRNAKDVGTEGCTAISESSMRAIQSRITDSAHPTLAVLPHEEFSKWAACFPGIPFAADKGEL